MNITKFASEHSLDQIRGHIIGIKQSTGKSEPALEQKLLKERMRLGGFRNDLTQRIGLALQLKIKQPRYQLTPEELRANLEIRGKEELRGIMLCAAIAVIVLIGMIFLGIYLWNRQRYYVYGKFTGKDGKSYDNSWYYSYPVPQDLTKFKGEGEDAIGKFTIEGQAGSNPYGAPRGTTMTFVKKYSNGQEHVFNGLSITVEGYRNRSNSGSTPRTFSLYKGTWSDKLNPSVTYYAEYKFK